MLHAIVLEKQFHDLIREMLPIAYNCVGQVAAATFHQMAGLLLYEDTTESMHRNKKCGSKAPHLVINTAAGSDPLTPGFPAVGLLEII